MLEGHTNLVGCKEIGTRERTIERLTNEEIENKISGLWFASENVTSKNNILFGVTHFAEHLMTNGEIFEIYNKL